MTTFIVTDSEQSFIVDEKKVISLPATRKSIRKTKPRLFYDEVYENRRLIKDNKIVPMKIPIGQKNNNKTSILHDLLSEAQNRYNQSTEYNILCLKHQSKNMNNYKDNYNILETSIATKSTFDFRHENINVNKSKTEVSNGDKISCYDVEKNSKNCESKYEEDSDENNTNVVKDIPKTQNSPGKFSVQIGLHLVLEHVLLDPQNQLNLTHSVLDLRRKIDFKGDKCMNKCKYNINVPFQFNLKKCELCNFKSESRLIIAHHLETFHTTNNCR